MATIDLTKITIVFREPGCDLMHLGGLVRRTYDEKYFLPKKRGIFQHTCRASNFYRQLVGSTVSLFPQISSYILKYFRGKREVTIS